MTKAEQDALIAYIDNTAGLVPTEINTQTGIMGEVIGRMPAGPDRTTLANVHAALNAANLKIGDRIGESKGMLNTLRAMILAIAVEPVEPPAPPSGPPAGVLPVDQAAGVDGGIRLTHDGKGMSPQNANYGCTMVHGAWYYIQADEDASVASMSSDGGYVALKVTDTPIDPAPEIMDGGKGGTSHIAEQRPVKAGQYVCMRIGPGGYSTARGALFSLKKYA